MILLLGGTTEARVLADRLRDLPVVTALAGATSDPARPAGDVVVGLAGGLAAWVHGHGVRAVVDATHPFATSISAQAAALDVPVLRLHRPGWSERPGDDWTWVATLEAAAAAVGRRRALVTTGRRLDAFAGCRGVARTVEPPADVPAGLELLLARGPFTVGAESRLLTGRAIGVVVTKDSGGSAPKLAAARELGLPVVVVERPPGPAVPTVTTVAQAEAWVRGR